MFCFVECGIFFVELGIFGKKIYSVDIFAGLVTTVRVDICCGVWIFFAGCDYFAQGVVTTVSMDIFYEVWTFFRSVWLLR